MVNTLIYLDSANTSPSAPPRCAGRCCVAQKSGKGSVEGCVFCAGRNPAFWGNLTGRRTLRTRTGTPCSSAGSGNGKAALSIEPTAVPTATEWQALFSGHTWSGTAVTFGFASGASDYSGTPYYSGYNEPAQFLPLSSHRPGHRPRRDCPLAGRHHARHHRGGGGRPSRDQYRRLVRARHRLGLLSGQLQFQRRRLVRGRQELHGEAGLRLAAPISAATNTPPRCTRSATRWG